MEDGAEDQQRSDEGNREEGKLYKRRRPDDEARRERKMECFSNKLGNRISFTENENAVEVKPNYRGSRLVKITEGQLQCLNVP